MTNPDSTVTPFGVTITPETLKATFAPLTQWEDKYRQLILLGKKLPAPTDELKARAQEIPGCENRVWLGYSVSPQGTLHFFGDSEGRIVRGLLAVLLTACEGKQALELLAGDPLARDIIIGVGHSVGRMLAVMVNLFNPQKILIGSPLNRAADSL